MSASKKNIYLISISAVLLFCCSACAKKISFQNSVIEPAAKGTIKITKDRNNNYAIKIQLQNMAASGRLQLPKIMYVVWMESDETSIKNIGRVKTGASLPLNFFKASFETLSAVKPTKIFITAEEDVSVKYPGPQLVLTTASL